MEIYAPELRIVTLKIKRAPIRKHKLFKIYKLTACIMYNNFKKFASLHIYLRVINVNSIVKILSVKYCAWMTVNQKYSFTCSPKFFVTSFLFLLITM